MTIRHVIRIFATLALATFLSACTTLSTQPPNQLLLGRMIRATVLVETSASLGSGVLIGRRMVLTAGHVVPSRLPAVKITFDDGRMISGERIFLSRHPDVALIRLVMDAPFAPVSVACNKMPLDTAVIVIGHPGLLRWFVGHGNVASMHRVVGIERNQIVLAIAVIPGSSGGPVFDSAGHVRGLIRAGLSRQGIPLPGFTLAVPSPAFCDLPEVSDQIVRAS